MTHMNLLRMYPIPADRPLRRVVFGITPPPEPVALRGDGIKCADEIPTGPFDLDWKDVDLGIKVAIRERTSGEVNAIVHALRPELQNQIVSVALVGPGEESPHRLLVALDKNDKDKWFGTGCFGQIDTLRQSVGSPITLVTGLIRIVSMSTSKAQPREFIASRTDIELIQDIRLGSRIYNDAFDALHERYNPNLVAFLKSKTGSWEDAEDAAQRAWSAILPMLRGTPGATPYNPEKGSIKTLLYKIAYRKGVDEARATRHEREYETADILDDKVDGSQQNPVDLTVWRESLEAIQKCLDQLPEIYRTVFILREIEGFSRDETAAILNIPVGTGDRRLHEAKKRLRDRLDDMGHNPNDE